MTTRGMQAPESLNLTRDGYASYSVSWEDAEHRYHIWIGLDHEPQRSGFSPINHDGATIYKNKINRQRGERTVQLDLEKHPAIATAVGALTNADYRKADAAYEAREAAENEKRRQDYIDSLREQAARVGFKLVPIEEPTP